MRKPLNGHLLGSYLLNNFWVLSLRRSLPYGRSEACACVVLPSDGMLGVLWMEKATRGAAVFQICSSINGSLVRSLRRNQRSWQVHKWTQNWLEGYEVRIVCNAVRTAHSQLRCIIVSIRVRRKNWYPRDHTCSSTGRLYTIDDWVHSALVSIHLK